MTRSVKKYVMLGAIAVMLLLAVTVPHTADNTLAQTAFIELSSSTVTVDYGYENSADNGLAETRKGMRIRASESGDTVEFSEKFRGTFELDFRVISDESYSGSLNAALGSEFINNELELNALSFKFTETGTGRYFVVKMKAGAPYDLVTPTVRVKTGTAECGLHYYNGESFPRNTGVQNSLGYYTRLNGTSFCNVAYTDGKLTQDGVKPVVLTFEPSTMCVYGVYYGQSVSTYEKRLILDLRNETYIGKNNTLETFSEYTVQMSFDEIATGKQATVVLYSINGSALDGATPSESLPVIFPDLKTDAVRGEKYVLPLPTKYSVAGKKDAAVTVIINAPDGDDVALYNADGGVSDGTYADGCYFIPSQTGLYKLVYKAAEGDKSGIAAEAEIKVYRELPRPEFIFSSEYSDITNVGVGYELPVYGASFVAPWKLQNARGTAFVTVTLNGTPIDGLDGVSANLDRTVVLDAPGTYEIVYYADEDRKFASDKIVVTAVDGRCNFYVSEAVGAYAIGSRINLPKVTAELNGKMQEATVLLIEPDGRLNTELHPLLTEKGTYKFVYIATFDGVAWQKVDKFVSDTAEESLFVSVKDSELKSGVYLNNSLSDIRGLLVTGYSDGASVRYSKVLNLSRKTRSESFIELAVQPTVYGEEDFNQLDILLTDVHDSTNFVKIIVYKGSWGNAISFVKAGAKGQVVFGLEKGKKATRFDLGTSVMMSFAGNRVIGSETLKLYYDNENKAVYADTLRTPSDNGLVNDLDSVDLQGETSVWGGFTTGEVILTVTQSSFNGAQGSYLITSIDGQPLGNTVINDNTPPEIYLDTLNYGNSTPVGVAGKSYKVFDARAYDRSDGEEREVETSVYSNYGTSSVVAYEVVNGTFVPDVRGEYTVVYRAFDKHGNASSRSYKVSVNASAEPIVAEFPSDLKTSYFVGEKIFAPDVKTSGGSGKHTITVVLEKDGSIVSEFEGGSYTFERAGVYELKTKAVDYVGDEKVFGKQITVAVSNAPIAEFPAMPKAFINGKTYKLPSFEAYDYTSGSKKSAIVETRVYLGPVAIGDGTVLENGVITANYPASVSAVTVRLSAKAATGGIESRDYVIPVLHVSDDNGLHLEKLFITSGVAADPKLMYSDFVSSSDGATFEFANPVIADDLTLEFGGDKKANAFGGVTITLTDSSDGNVSLSFSFKKGSSTSTASAFSATGAKKNTAIGSFYNDDDLAMPFRLNYKNMTCSLYDMNAIEQIAKFTLCDNGSAFNGFPSGMVTVKFTFDGVVGNSVVRLAKIANQPITNRDRDAISPQITFETEVPLTGRKGEVVRLPKAVISDLIDPNASASLTVTSPDGVKIISDNNITSSGAEFTPTRYGVYRVVYTAMDEDGNEARQTFRITVDDLVKPVLTVSGAVPEKGAVGKSVNLPVATATDDFTENLKVEIFVIDPDGVMYPLDGNTLKLTIAGKYRIRYFARDDNYNFAYEEFALIAE